jgi:hypothetical protein
MARITTSQPSSSLQEKRNLATKLIFGPRYTISDHLLVVFAPKIPSVGGFGQDQVSFKILSTGEASIGAFSRRKLYQIDLC